MLLDGFDGGRSAFGFADHRDQAGFAEHHVGEAVHAGGGGGAGWADGFVTHRVDRADVINHAVGEINRQIFAFGQHVFDTFVRGIAAGQHLAVEQQRVAGFPAGDFGFGQGVEVDFFALDVVGRPDHVGPQVEAGWRQIRWATAIEHKVGVAGCRAVRNHRHRLAGGVRWVHLDFDVEHGGQATQALRANAEGVDFVEQLQPHLFKLAELGAGRRLGLEFVHVEVVHQAFFGHQHGFFRGAANADAEHARRAPASAHGRHGFEHPVDDGVTWVEHDQLAFVLRAAAFGCDGDVDSVARHDLGEDHGGRVVLRVLAVKVRVGDDAGAQRVVGVVVGLAYTLVNGVLKAAGEARQPHVHADFQKHVDDARVLADGAVAHRAHLAVGQNLRNRVFGGRALFAFVGAGQMGDVVSRVVVADVLQCGGDGFDEVGLLNIGAGRHGHSHLIFRRSRKVDHERE